MKGSRLNNSRTKSPGRSEDKYKEKATGKTRKCQPVEEDSLSQSSDPSLHSTYVETVMDNGKQSRVPKKMTEQWEREASKSYRARVANATIKASVRGSGNTSGGTQTWALSVGEKSYSGCDGQAGVSWAEGPGDWGKGCARQGRGQRQEVVERRRY